MTQFDLCPDTGLAITPPMAVRPEMIDYNGHVNVAFYVKLFDEGLDILFEKIGLSENYIRTRNMSFFALEAHVRYLREVHLGDPLQVSILMVGTDAKRLHLFKELRHAKEGWVSATSETMTLHVDMSVRKVAPFPEDIQANLRKVAEAHAQVPRPDGIGRAIGMPTKK